MLIGRPSCVKVVAVALALALISTVCAAQTQTIRSQRKLQLLDGMTGVITYITGTRVTVAPEDQPGESVTVHQKDASGLKVGDTVRMEGGTLVKVSAQPDQPAQPVVEGPKETGETKKAKEAPEVKEPPPTGQAEPAQSQQK